MAEAFLGVAGLIMARLAPLIWMIPPLGGRLLPPTIRLAVAVAIALPLAPTLVGEAQRVVALGPWFTAAVVLKEMLVGSAFGFLAGLVFWGAQSAGWLADQSRGAGMAEVLDPTLGARSSPLGVLLQMLTIVLFFALGGHRLLLLAVAHSYELIPLGGFPSLSGAGRFALYCGRLTGEMLALAVALVAPVIAALMLADLSLGWVNRFVPQVNVFFLAMPLRALLGLVLLTVSLGAIVSLLPQSLDLALQRVERAMGALAR